MKAEAKVSVAAGVDQDVQLLALNGEWTKPNRERQLQPQTRSLEHRRLLTIAGL